MRRWLETENDLFVPSLPPAHVPNTGWRGSDLYRRWKLGTLPEGTTVRQWLGYPAAVAFHSTDGTSCTREATAEKTIAHTTVVR